jgi:ribosome-associated protein
MGSACIVAGMDDLRVNRDLVIPAARLRWRFDPSGGPGGQHANKAATRVELSLQVAGSGLFDADTELRVVANLAGRLVDGALAVVVDESRSQWRNRQIARRRLAEIIDGALRPPPPRRRPTRPSRAAKARRLAAKRARAETKRLRRRPEAGE